MSADWCRLWHAGRGRRLCLAACRCCMDVQAARPTSSDTACLRPQRAALQHLLASEVLPDKHHIFSGR